MQKQDIFVSIYIHTVYCAKMLCWKERNRPIDKIDEITVFFHSLILSIILFLSPWFSRQRMYTAVSRKHQVFQETSKRDGLHHLWKWRFSSCASDALHAGQNWVLFFFQIAYWSFIRLKVSRAVKLRLTYFIGENYLALIMLTFICSMCHRLDSESQFVKDVNC